MTAKIKLNAASGGGSFSLQAPSSSANNRVFTLPDVADATMATVNGITMCDTWVVTTAFTNTSGNAVTSNWYNISTQNSLYGGIGSSMTESSGVFTFPSNGIYLVYHSFFGQSEYTTGIASAYAGAEQYLSTDSGSNFNFRQGSYNSAYGAGSHFTVEGYVVYDITDFSTHRLRFHVSSQNLTKYFGSGTTSKQCGATFMKLGET